MRAFIIEDIEDELAYEETSSHVAASEAIPPPTATLRGHENEFIRVCDIGGVCSASGQNCEECARLILCVAVRLSSSARSGKVV